MPKGWSHNGKAPVPRIEHYKVSHVIPHCASMSKRFVVPTPHDTKKWTKVAKTTLQEQVFFVHQNQGQTGVVTNTTPLEPVQICNAGLIVAWCRSHTQQIVWHVQQENISEYIKEQPFDFPKTQILTQLAYVQERLKPLCKSRMSQGSEKDCLANQRRRRCRCALSTESASVCGRYPVLSKKMCLSVLPSELLTLNCSNFKIQWIRPLKHLTREIATWIIQVRSGELEHSTKEITT